MLFLRSAVIHLQFDDEETEPQLDESASETSRLEKISNSPVTSNDTFFSFHSSLSSKDADRRSREGRLSFKLPLGLEGNIETSVENQLVEDEHDEPTLVEDLEQEISTDSEKNIENFSQANVMKYLNSPYIQSSLKKKSILSDVEVLKDDPSNFDHSFELNSSNGTKTVVIEYSTAPKTPITHTTVYDIPPSINEEESDDEVTNKHLKWTVEQSGSLQGRLKLEVHKQNSQGDEKSVASITLSEEMTIYHSEPMKDTSYERIANEMPSNDQLTTDKDKVANDTLLLENTQSVTSRKETEKSVLMKIPLDCESVEAEQSPMEKSSTSSLKESKMFFSKITPSRSKKNKGIDQLSRKETPSSAQLGQTVSFVNKTLQIPVIKETNLSILNKTSTIDQTKQSYGEQTPIDTEQKETEHPLLNEPINKTSGLKAIESETNKDVSINTALVSPAQSEKDVSSLDITADQMSESLVVNRDVLQQANNVSDSPLPHILDELLQKGRISFSLKPNQKTSHENDFCKDNTEESVESSLIFKHAFANPTSVALNSNQASVRWEFGASAVQEKQISTLEALSQEETVNVEPVEENMSISCTYSSKNQKELENTTFEKFVNNASIVKASQSISADVHSRNSSICTADELVIEKTASSDIAEAECRAEVRTSPSKVSSDFTFVIESATSLEKAFQGDEDDPAADFDLKLSEGDSVVEINSQNINADMCTSEANQEPSYEILKPVQFQIGMDNLVADNVEIEHFSEGMFTLFRCMI